MDSEELNQALYEKMSEELAEYRASLLTMAPEEILENASGYTLRENILLCMEHNDLSDEEAQALLNAENPLELIYQAFDGQNPGYMDALQNCVEQEAQKAREQQAEEQKALKDTPIYPYAAEQARMKGELDAYRASRKANIACKEAIEKSVSEHYDGMYLAPEAVSQVASQFGYERMFYVLANTVRLKEQDGRFSGSNKLWAYSIPVIADENDLGHNRNIGFEIHSHPAILDGFITAARQEYELLQPRKATRGAHNQLRKTGKTREPKKRKER